MPERPRATGTRTSGRVACAAMLRRGTTRSDTRHQSPLNREPSSGGCALSRCLIVRCAKSQTSCEWSPIHAPVIVRSAGSSGRIVPLQAISTPHPRAKRATVQHIGNFPACARLAGTQPTRPVRTFTQTSTGSRKIYPELRANYPLTSSWRCVGRVAIPLATQRRITSKSQVARASTNSRRLSRPHNLAQCTRLGQEAGERRLRGLERQQAAPSFPGCSLLYELTRCVALRPPV